MAEQVGHSELKGAKVWLTRQMQPNAQAGFNIGGVQPVKVVKIQGALAGKVGV